MLHKNALTWWGSQVERTQDSGQRLNSGLGIFGNGSPALIHTLRTLVQFLDVREVTDGFHSEIVSLSVADQGPDCATKSTSASRIAAAVLPDSTYVTNNSRIFLNVLA